MELSGSLEKERHHIYRRFEWFWHEPEVVELLTDIFDGESEEFSKLTDMILALEGEDWKVAIIPKTTEEKK